MKVDSDNNFDAIVVGAGLNGSWVAKELTAGGMNVALVDAGSILPDSEFRSVQLQQNVFNLRYHLFRIKLLLKGDTDRAFSKFITGQTSRLFLDRRRDPYVTPASRDFSWLRVRAVGGRGHLWGRVMLRFTDRQFTTPGFEWPVSYGDLAPFYDEIEELLEMGGAPALTPEVPEGKYIQERSLHPLEQQFRESVSRRWPERHLVVNHVAGYEPAPLSPMLQLANGTGRLTLQPNKVVLALSTTGSENAVTGITAVCTKSGAIGTMRAPYIVLTASAFESVRILLNSKCERFPSGVGNCNGLLGTRILEHMADGVLAAIPVSMRENQPRYQHNPFKLNAEPHGFYIPPFTHSESATGHRFGYGMQGTISTDTGIFYLGGFGETVPSDNNRLRLSEVTKDRFGVPAASIDFSWAPEDIALWKDMNRVLAEMTEAFCTDAGIKLDHPLADRARSFVVGNRLPVPGSNHECGGARMGFDPATSVVDPYNRIWDAPNVLVCDTACFPTIPHQNPTLTSMALAVRASRELLSCV